MPGSREEDFLRNIAILHFLPQNYLPFGLGVMKFTISGLLPLMMLHTKFGKDWPSSFWEEDVNAWRTTDDDGRQPIAIGHLSHSGDLITLYMDRLNLIDFAFNPVLHWVVSL